MFYRIGSSSRNCGSDVIWGPKTSKSAKKGRERERERDEKIVTAAKTSSSELLHAGNIKEKPFLLSKKDFSLALSHAHTISLSFLSLWDWKKGGRERGRGKNCTWPWSCCWRWRRRRRCRRRSRRRSRGGWLFRSVKCSLKKEENTHGLFCYNLKQSTYLSII